MNRRPCFLAAVVFSGLMIVSTAYAQTPPKMKMTTPTPPSITTPDSVNTRIGNLKFFDGFPDDSTVQKVYDNLDFMRGVEAFLNAMPGASTEALRVGFVSQGADNNHTVLIMENLMDSKSLFLTANTESVYNMMWIDTKDGPVVIETPPNVLGIIDDHWFQYVADFGRAGPDKGKGGKFLLLPPGYKGEVPNGYFVLRSATYGNLVFWRGFIENGSTKPAVESSKKFAKVYRLSEATNPPPMRFINVSGQEFNTVHANDFQFYEEVNNIIQYEPNEAYSPEVLGTLAAIDIEKGKPFSPDARMKKTLTEAVAVGNATARDCLQIATGRNVQLSEQRLVHMLCRGRLSIPLATRCTRSRCAGPLHLLRHRHHTCHVDADGWRRLAIRCRSHGFRRQAARRGQDLQDSPAAQHPSKGLLVVRGLRQPNSLDAPDRCTVPQHRQPERGDRRESRHLSRCVVRPGSAEGA